MRYLVVIPGMQQIADTCFRDVDSDNELIVGDELLVDDLLVRVRAAINVPAGDGYDGTLVCTAD